MTNPTTPTPAIEAGISDAALAKLEARANGPSYDEFSKVDMECVIARLRSTEAASSGVRDGWRDIANLHEQIKQELMAAIADRVNKTNNTRGLPRARAMSDAINNLLRAAPIPPSAPPEPSGASQGEGITPEVAGLMLAIEKLAALISEETPDDLQPSEADERRYKVAKPIFEALGMTIAGGDSQHDPIGWGFDWPDIDPALKTMIAEFDEAVSRGKHVTAILARIVKHKRAAPPVTGASS